MSEVKTFYELSTLLAITLLIYFIYFHSPSPPARR